MKLIINNLSFSYVVYPLRNKETGGYDIIHHKPRITRVFDADKYEITPELVALGRKLLVTYILKEG